jgi:hypothetical protein
MHCCLLSPLGTGRIHKPLSALLLAEESKSERRRRDATSAGAFVLLDQTITAGSKPNTTTVKIVRLTADTHDRWISTDPVEPSIDVPESVRLCVQVWAILGRLHDERSQEGLPHTSRSASYTLWHHPVSAGVSRSANGRPSAAPLSFCGMLLPRRRLKLGYLVQEDGEQVRGALVSRPAGLIGLHCLPK